MSIGWRCIDFLRARRVCGLPECRRPLDWHPGQAKQALCTAADPVLPAAAQGRTGAHRVDTDRAACYCRPVPSRTYDVISGVRANRRQFSMSGAQTADERVLVVVDTAPDNTVRVTRIEEE